MTIKNCKEVCQSVDQIIKILKNNKVNHFHETLIRETTMKNASSRFQNKCLTAVDESMPNSDQIKSSISRVNESCIAMIKTGLAIVHLTCERSDIDISEKLKIKTVEKGKEKGIFFPQNKSFAVNLYAYDSCSLTPLSKAIFRLPL